MLVGIAFFVGGYDFGDTMSWNTVCDSFTSCFGCVPIPVGQFVKTW
jgi:hypothetical protein